MCATFFFRYPSATHPRDKVAHTDKRSPTKIMPLLFRRLLHRLQITISVIDKWYVFQHLRAID